MDIQVSRIDWFAVDLMRLEEVYFDCRDFAERWNRACAQLSLCESGDCTCESRKMKRDGTPDRRYDCPEVPNLHEWLVCNQWDSRLSEYQMFEELGFSEVRAGGDQ